MFVLKTLLLASATTALAAPTWSVRRSYDDMESRDLDHFDIDARALDAFEYFEARDLSDFDLYDLYARTDPKFADLKPGDKGKAKDFVSSARPGQLADAAASGSSAKTVHKNDQFHLDRQQPGSDRHASKAAVQLNKPHKNKGPTTVGQVAVHHGTTPDPKTVGARLKHSINTGHEQKLPHHSKQDRKAANVAANDAKRAAKAGKVAAKQAAGNARAKAGIFKKGNGKASAKKRT